MPLFYEILLLTTIGFLVGIINTLSGGGSILSLPLLIFLGLDTAVANGTNRIAIFLQNLSSLAGFKSKGFHAAKLSWYLGVASLCGSVVGALLAVEIKDAVFNKILALVMVLVVIFMFIKPSGGSDISAERLTGKPLVLSTVFFFFIGIYGGFIQAGTGIFMMLVLSGVNHLSLIKTNVVKALVMLIYTTGALAVFLYFGKVNFKYGLLLAGGQSLGGWLSSRWSVKKGDGIIKAFMLVMVFVIAVKLWFF